MNKKRDANLILDVRALCASYFVQQLASGRPKKNAAQRTGRHVGSGAWIQL
jgi:RNase adaptor protein for sRNA GlmZ degradation